MKFEVASEKTRPIFPPGSGPGVENGGANAQNEANLAGRPGPWRAKCAKQTQFGRSVRTLAGETYKTKPICGRRSAHYSIIPPFQSAGERVKRTQFPPPCRSGERRCRGTGTKRTQFGLARPRAA